MTRIVALVILLLGFGCTEELATLISASGPVPPGTSIPVASGSTVAAAQEHTCAIFSGRIACWGINDRGTLGQAAFAAQKPLLIPGERVWVSIAGHGDHTCARDSEGRVACWGYNGEGQLGSNDFEDRFEPTDVAGLVNTRMISASYGGSCALQQDGQAFCWGENAEGMLGLNDGGSPLPNQAIPKMVPTEPFTLISVGQGHTCGIRDTGLLSCWGRNENSELGLGPDMPIQVREVTQVGASGWRAVSGGQNHSCGVKRTGALFCWGDNSSGQLGTGDRDLRQSPTMTHPGPFESVATETFHGCAVGERKLFCWGRNIEGQLGTGDIDDRLTPVQVGIGIDWIEVSTGRFHSCARSTDGTVFCTGSADNGKLGNGDLERRRDWTPTAQPFSL